MFFITIGFYQAICNIVRVYNFKTSSLPAKVRQRGEREAWRVVVFDATSLNKCPQGQVSCCVLCCRRYFQHIATSLYL